VERTGYEPDQQLREQLLRLPNPAGLSDLTGDYVELAQFERLLEEPGYLAAVAFRSDEPVAADTPSIQQTCTAVQGMASVMGVALLRHTQDPCLVVALSSYKDEAARGEVQPGLQQLVDKVPTLSVVGRWSGPVRRDILDLNSSS
jgi:hypothetical protein